MCYSTKVSKNVHVQAYLGRKVDVSPEVLPPKNFKVKGDSNVICLPFEKYVDLVEEPQESFKVL